MSSLDDVDDYDPNYRPAADSSAAAEHKSSLDDIDDYDPSYQPDGATTNPNQSATQSNAPPAASVSDLLDDFFDEVSDTEKQLTIDRINRSLRLNPYDVLDIPLSEAHNDTLIKKQFRHLSLVTHPDKSPNMREAAERAFTSIGKAKDELLNESLGVRSELLETLDIIQQRVTKAMQEELVQRRKKQKKSEPQQKIIIGGVDVNAKAEDNDTSNDNDPTTVDTASPEYADRVHREFNEELIAKAWLRKQMVQARGNEKINTAKQESDKREQAEREQKEKAEWENRTEVRVGGWRDFAQKRGGRGGIKRFSAR